MEKKISMINFKDPRQLLNRRSELIFKCRHKSKFKLTWSKVIEGYSSDKKTVDMDFGWNQIT